MRYNSARHFAARGLVLAGLFSGLVGCREAALALGNSSAVARANADDLFQGLSLRFGPAVQAPGYEEARSRLGRSALVPSRLLDDSVVWTSFEEGARRLEFSGRLGPSGYVLGIRDSASLLKPGDYRRSTHLRVLGDDQYEWTIRDELAIGSVASRDLGAALSAMFAVAERSDSDGLRVAYRTALPRTTAALGRLFTLDSIAVEPARGGGALLSIRATMRASGILDAFPNLSRFLERYVTPTVLALVVEDQAGERWWTVQMERNRLAINLRVNDGRLAPLEGPARTMPNQMRARVDLSTRIRVFNVGISDLSADVTLNRSPEESGFTARFPREPDWHLPLLVERLIRTPLRRPFEGSGALLTLATEHGSGRTVLVRDYQVAVRESAIVRWFGGLGSSAFNDFRGRVERESDEFNGAFFAALRADALAIVP